MQNDVGQLLIQLGGSLVTSLVAVVVVLWVERARKPRLSFEIEEPPVVLPDGRKFLRVLVHNKPIHPLLGFFVARQPALMCRAHITFLREDNQPVFRRGHRMTGRWSRSPEPSYIVPSGPQLWRIRDPSRTRNDMDIPPNSHEVLDVVMRAPPNTECFGWHNDYIENPNPTADQVFGLPQGRYQALVRVRTGGEDFRHVLRIVNDVPIDHFRLEELQTQSRLNDTGL